MDIINENNKELKVDMNIDFSKFIKSMKRASIATLNFKKEAEKMGLEFLEENEENAIS